MRESGSIGYDLSDHESWEQYEELVAKLATVTEQRDEFRRRSVVERVEEQVDSGTSLERVNAGLLELRDALAQLVADENTIVGIVSDGYGYPPNQAAQVVRSDPRVGQLLHLGKDRRGGRLRGTEA